MPPFASADYPLVEAGAVYDAARAIDPGARLLHLNQRFSERIGPRTYRSVVEMPRSFFLGEWLGFAPLREAGRAERPAEDVRAGYRSHLASKGPPDLDDEEVDRLLAVAGEVGPFLEEAAEAIARDRPAGVLVACVSQQLGAAASLVDRLGRRSDVPAFLFGRAIENPAQARVLLDRIDGLDGVLLRSPPDLVADRLDALLAGKPVPGVLRREDDPADYREPEATGRRGPIGRAPDYGSFYEDRDEDPSTTVIPYQSSHGCWWGDRSLCSFCGLIESGQAFVSKDPETVVEEIVDLVRRYETLSVVTADLILDERYVDTVFARLAELDLDLDLFYETRPDLGKEQLVRLRDGGLTSLLAGIESFDDATLKEMRKGTTSLHNVRFLKWCSELELRLSWNLLYGFPNETADSLRRQAERLPRLFHLVPPLNVSPIRIERGSPYQRDPERHGIRILGPAEGLARAIPWPDDEVGTLATVFEWEYADGRDVEAMAAPLLEAARAWLAAWSPYRLYWLRGPGLVKVFDSREEETEIVTLRGWRARAFEGLDGIRTIDRLADEVEAPADEVRDFVGFLDERALVFGGDERWVSVVPRGDPHALARQKFARRRTRATATGEDGR